MPKLLGNENQTLDWKSGQLAPSFGNFFDSCPCSYWMAPKVVASGKKNVLIRFYIRHSKVPWFLCWCSDIFELLKSKQKSEHFWSCPVPVQQLEQYVNWYLITNSPKRFFFNQTEWTLSLKNHLSMDFVKSYFMNLWVVEHFLHQVRVKPNYFKEATFFVIIFTYIPKIMDTVKNYLKLSSS